MKIRDLPAHRRPREKFLEKGARALTDHELLSIVLQQGSVGKNAVQLAQSVLHQHSLTSFSKLNFNQLKQIKGIGPAKASMLLAVTELSQRIHTHEDRGITRPIDVLPYLSEIKHKKQEYLLGLYLDARHQVIQQETLTIGTVNANLIHAREVFRPALLHAAAGVIIAHNHPSGEVTPSVDDLEATDKLVETGVILDIPLIDHVIVGPKSWMSFKEQGLL